MEKASHQHHDGETASKGQSQRKNNLTTANQTNASSKPMSQSLHEKLK